MAYTVSSNTENTIIVAACYLGIYMHEFIKYVYMYSKIKCEQNCDLLNHLFRTEHILWAILSKLAAAECVSHFGRAKGHFQNQNHLSTLCMCNLFA